MAPKPKKKKDKEKEDHLNALTEKELKELSENMKKELKQYRQDRQYQQMDRDMVEQLYNNTVAEIDEYTTKISNKET